MVRIPYRSRSTGTLLPAVINAASSRAKGILRAVPVIKNQRKISVKNQRNFSVRRYVADLMESLEFESYRDSKADPILQLQYRVC